MSLMIIYFDNEINHSRNKQHLLVRKKLALWACKNNFLPMQKILDGHVVFSYWARKIYFYGTFKQ